MSKKLTGKALAKSDAKRNVWQEVLDGVREIKAERESVKSGAYVCEGKSLSIVQREADGLRPAVVALSAP